MDVLAGLTFGQLKVLHFVLCRFEIEKKLKRVKRQQRRSKPWPKDRMGVSPADSSTVASVSERSKERRKNIEDRKDSKKTSAFQDLKARREEKLKKGENLVFDMCLLLDLTYVICMIVRHKENVLGLATYSDFYVSY